MIAVIFEVEPREGQTDPYLDMAAEMRPLAEAIDGFISVERFQSLSDDRKLLSISFWRGEAALEEWRRLASHRRAQTAGRTRFFDDYRLRVAHVLRDYGMSERSEAPADSRAVHDKD
jgi:heme-degrading monooxygenase HmoA